MEESQLEDFKNAIRTQFLSESSELEAPRGRKRFPEGLVKGINVNGDKFAHRYSSLSCIEDTIGHFVQTMLSYPSVIGAFEHDNTHFRFHLQNFLLAHLDQLQDNKRFMHQPSWSPTGMVIFKTPRSSFSKWLQNTGSNSVSALMSFSYLTCILGASSSSIPARKDENVSCFNTVEQKHYAADFSARLAAMSRLYNDYGSISRDQAEANVNCVNFPEFHAQLDGLTAVEEKQASLKRTLLDLAEYERGAASCALGFLVENLRSSGGAREENIARGIALFMGKAALYADMYAVKDLSNANVRPDQYGSSSGK